MRDADFIKQIAIQFLYPGIISKNGTVVQLYNYDFDVIMFLLLDESNVADADLVAVAAPKNITDSFKSLVQDFSFYDSYIDLFGTETGLWIHKDTSCIIQEIIMPSIEKGLIFDLDELELTNSEWYSNQYKKYMEKLYNERQN